MVRDEDIREVRDRTDVTDLIGERITLRRKGGLYWGLCPFHSEKTPSFKVDPDVGLYHCFGCGESGDAFTFVMKTEGLDFLDAVRFLAERAHYVIQEAASGRRGPDRGRMVDAHRAAQAFYTKLLTSGKGADESQAREYLGGRGIHSDTARRFSLGWAPGGTELVDTLTTAGFTPDELVQAGLAVRQEGGRVADRFRRRVMFPIRDTAGRVVAFGGRVLDDSHPKYLNSADSPLFRKGKLLYGLDLAKQAIQAERTAVIVEGYTDVIAAHVAGAANVVATLGTAFTEDHLRLLSRFADRVVLVFDADAAGLAAAERGLRYASEYGVPAEGLVASVVDQGKVDVRVAVLPEGKDPADLLGDDPGAFRAAIEAAVPLVDFAIERRVARHDVTSLSGRLEAAREALAVVAAIQSLPARQAYLERLSTRLNLEPHALEAELARVGPAVDMPRRAPTLGSATGAPGGVGAPFAGLEETPEGRAEVQALTVVLHHRGLLAEYAEAFAGGLFSYEATRRVWDAIEASEGDIDARELVAGSASDPVASAALASLLLRSEDAARLAQDFAKIVRRLKEFALGRQIEELKARLAESERTGQGTRDVAAALWHLQQERHRLRGADASDGHGAPKKDGG